MQVQPKILVIDDDLDFVAATKIVLESEAYEVITAYNKEEALEKAETANPDLIILDIMMKQIDDGFDVCRELKKNPKHAHIPILMLTAITERTGFKFSPTTDGEWLPADDYIDKPIQPAELLRRVANLLKRRMEEA